MHCVMKLSVACFAYIIVLVIRLTMTTAKPFGTAAAFASLLPDRKEPGSSFVLGQPTYGIANSDLSRKWIRLVQDAKVVATVDIQSDSENVDEKVAVRYGVRLVERESGYRCEEFVESDDEFMETESSKSVLDVVQKINSTLARIQERSAKSSSSFDFGVAVESSMDGDFSAQLQLVRTLRPPPSEGFAEATTSVPPTYDSAQDSFLHGSLRLELRPLVATLDLPELVTPWDVFHNVSPADSRGHFLILPKLSDRSNWRGQIFTKEDCNDMVHLACSIKPAGSLLLGFNSVGGGASQNHIHCHAWPSPPLPLKQASRKSDRDEQKGWNCYAASKVTSVYDFCDLHDGKVKVSLLEYPVCCIKLSANQPNLCLMGQTLANILDALHTAPFNIGFLNREQEENGRTAGGSVSQACVDVYVFVRSKERSSLLSSLKLGISEMMGVFHAQSEAELSVLGGSLSIDQDEEGPMVQALRDVSVEPMNAVWDNIVAKLLELDHEPSSRS